MFPKILVGLAIVVFGWAVLVRPLSAHGPRQSYVVQPYDTLWTIASSHYAGDSREAIYRIQKTNHLSGATLRPGQTLVLP